MDAYVRRSGGDIQSMALLCAHCIRFVKSCLKVQVIGERVLSTAQPSSVSAAADAVGSNLAKAPFGAATSDPALAIGNGNKLPTGKWDKD